MFKKGLFDDFDSILLSSLIILSVIFFVFKTFNLLFFLPAITVIDCFNKTKWDVAVFYFCSNTFTVFIKREVVMKMSF